MNILGLSLLKLESTNQGPALCKQADTIFLYILPWQVNIPCLGTWLRLLQLVTQKCHLSH